MKLPVMQETCREEEHLVPLGTPLATSRAYQSPRTQLDVSKEEVLLHTRKSKPNQLVKWYLRGHTDQRWQSRWHLWSMWLWGPHSSLLLALAPRNYLYYLCQMELNMELMSPWGFSGRNARLSVRVNHFGFCTWDALRKAVRMPQHFNQLTLQI